MVKKLRMIFPFLFAIFPVLSLYFHNVEQVTLSEVLLPTGAILTFTLFLLLGLTRILKRETKAAIVVTIFLFMTFSYEPFFGLAQSIWKTKNLSYFDPIYVTFWIAIFACLAYLVISTNKNLEALAKTLAIAAVSLIAIPLVSIAVYAVKTNAVRQVDLRWSGRDNSKVAGVKTSSGLPDIYYIVFDRYGNAETLKDVYNFENQEFLDGLKAKGFFIADKSTANYLKTAQSLASSLNMEYINYLSPQLGEDSTNLLPLYSMLQENRVAKFLKARGYKFIHLGSWWAPTSRNKYADVNYNLHFLPEFTGVLLRTTTFYPLSVYLGIYDVRREQFERVNFKFEKLGEIPNLPEPTFTFAHMLIPHDPYVADKDGSFLAWGDFKKRQRKENFINQLIFTNKKITELVDKILSTSDTPPIIIIQADEGPFPSRYLADEKGFNWETASSAELKEKMRILNAYYLPDNGIDYLYDSITPVNTFRVIFDKYFGTEYGTLPDKNFIFLDENHPYKFSEVTDKFH
jgi:hypothetical protein